VTDQCKVGGNLKTHCSYCVT